MIRLGILDQSPAMEGQPAANAIRRTVELARASEGMGYHRFWVAEHHGSRSIVGTAPEILTAAVASVTSGMRVGPAGILLPRYSPFKIAEQFRVLEALYPGRIDLGIGRSPAGDAAVLAALDRGRPGDERHGDEVRRLLAWLENDDGAEGALASPRGPGAPETWILSSSMAGARLAADLGRPLAFNFSNDTLKDGVDGPLAIYRDTFRPSSRCPEPYVSLLVWALAADTDEQAHWLFGSRALWRVRLDRGQRLPIASPWDAAAHGWTDAEKRRVAGMHERYVVGSAKSVNERLAAIVARYDPQEIVLNTWAYDPADQLHSFALIASSTLRSPAE